MRQALFLRARGRCERCGLPIEVDAFHVAHLRAHSHGGVLVEENLGAWCPPCNLTFGADDVTDTRLQPRQWQWNALTKVVEQIAGTRVATVAAAPGAGKTVFAALVFEALRDSDRVDRMVVLAPRRTLVLQWHDSLFRTRHVELRPNGEVERSGQDGVVVTYQSLSADTVGVHRRQAEIARTLFVLDEVHHVGEPAHSGGRPAWARYVSELIGDVRTDIHVTGVLNLSGTLWRSRTTERISTVRYQPDDDGKLVSDVDFEITAAELIREGQLRPVDLYRRGADVELVNLAQAERIVSKIADLNEAAVGRAAIRELPTDAAWRDSFVGTILDCLEKRHRDLGNGPAKALIVARSQPDARAFQETANRLMRERGLRPIAELAVSDEPDAHDTLQKFRRLDRPGVLCTVDMAGEGYDCPDIVVVGFATNKLTPLYVRQVVARAQRVTAYERDMLGRPIPAAVIIPDVPQLVDVMSSILEPMRHELRDPIEDNAEPGQPAELQGSLLDLAIPMLKYTLDGVNGYAEGDVRVTGELQGDVAMNLVRLVEPEARRVGLPESDAPRIIVAVRSALETRQESQPFDRLPGQDEELAVALAPTEPGERSATVEPLSVEALANGLRSELGRLGKWWHVNGNTPVAVFNNEVNRAGAIGKGGRDNAEVDKLRRALRYARTQVASHCRANNLRRPAASDDLL
ncbi:MAG: DEAD/DEAH box helicase family protein [Actinomycetota bacterium]|nr:DEAD/DEAH box helicase family protein [Actinomycetota bacterium]